MDIYKNRSKFRLVFVVIALILGTVSLLYTNFLVNKLATREKKLINLYAQTVKFVIESDLDEDLTLLLNQVILTNESIPVILVRNNKIVDHRNIEIPDNISEKRKKKILESELEIMKAQHPAIPVIFDQNENFIYYRDSDILYQLRYYPYVQLMVLAIFGFLTFLAFSYFKRAEQNRVWVGLAKETAHQLGTPISSLMAWMDYLKSEPALKNGHLLLEIEKDIRRLEMITARFSSIGSEPVLKEEDLYFIVLGIINYLKKRISTKVVIEVNNQIPRGKTIKLNRYLFEWVIENLCKNAVDAMGGAGKLTVELGELPEGDVFIEMTDTGKGIPKKDLKKVFNPGFTTKKRGWGLGLTLAKRIIEEYHLGKLWVKTSEPEKGTTFRMILKA